MALLWCRNVVCARWVGWVTVLLAIAVTCDTFKRFLNRCPALILHGRATGPDDPNLQKKEINLYL